MAMLDTQSLKFITHVRKIDMAREEWIMAITTETPTLKCGSCKSQNYRDLNQLFAKKDKTNQQMSREINE